MKLTHISRTDVGLVRPANEDNIGSLLKQEGIYTNIYIVCDGMGGHVGGARASQSAVRSIKEYFSNTPNPTPNIALKEAIEFANMQIFGDAQSNPEFKGMGTTVTLMVESEGLLYIAHVGDSRIYINTDKKLYRITKDHSFVQSLVDAGQLTDAQMETHPRKNELTQALGIAIDVDVEVAPQHIRAKKGDKFLLCSDGLCGLINDTRISSIINSNSDLEETVDQLIEDAKKAGGHDNISADLIEVTESEFTKSKFIDKNNVPVSNMGTQQVFIDPKNDKSISDKKLIQIILAVVVLISLVGGGYLIFGGKSDKKGKQEETKTKVLTLKQKFKSLDRNLHENDSMFYAFTTEMTESKFTNAINESGKYKELSDPDHRDKQQFYLSSEEEIITVVIARKKDKKDNLKLQEGSVVFILKNDLELKANKVTIEENDALDIGTEITEREKARLANIEQELKNIKNRIQTNAYQNQEDKVPLEYEIKYIIKNIWLQKGHEHKDKGGECIVKFKIQHTSGKKVVGEYSHPYPATKEHQNEQKLTELKIQLRNNPNARVLHAAMPTEDQVCIVMADQLASTCQKQKNIKVEYIITVGGKSFEGSFKETIPGDPTLCEEDIPESTEENTSDNKEEESKTETDKEDNKELTGYFPKYEWHKEGCLDDRRLENKTVEGKQLFKYTANLVDLNRMYDKEIKIMDNEKFSKYTIKEGEGKNCQGQVNFFYEGSNPHRQDSKNEFTEEQLKILSDCGITTKKMCP